MRRLLAAHPTGCNLCLGTSHLAFEKQQTRYPRCKDQNWFRDFLEAEQSERRDGNGDCGQVNQRTPTKDESCSTDCTHGGGRHALHECLHLEVLCKASIIRSASDHDQIRRNKNSECGQHRSNRSRYQVPDESRRDDDRPRRYHCYRNRIKKLSLREPMGFAYDPAIEKRHNRQTTPENKSTRLQKKKKESPYRSRCGWP